MNRAAQLAPSEKVSEVPEWLRASRRKLVVDAEAVLRNPDATDQEKAIAQDMLKGYYAVEQADLLAQKLSALVAEATRLRTPLTKYRDFTAVYHVEAGIDETRKALGYKVCLADMIRSIADREVNRATA